MSNIIRLAALSAAVPLFGHWPWIEPASASAPARVYFGVYPSDRMTGARVQAMAGARLWTYAKGGGHQAAKPSVEADALGLGNVDGAVMDYTFGVFGQHGPPTLVLYTAKAYRGLLPAQSPAALPLEVVPAADMAPVANKPIRLRLLRAGKPLAGVSIHAYTSAQGARHLAARKSAKAEHKHDHKAASEESSEIPSDSLRWVTGADGEITATLPTTGQYQFHVSVREQTPGVHEGKAYQSVTLMSTLCVDVVER